MADYWNLYPNLRNEEIQKKFLDDYSVDRYGYRMFILKNSFFNDVIFIWIINFLSVFLFTLIHLIYFLFKGQKITLYNLKTDISEKNDVVIEYIMNQEEHHKSETYIDELKRLLNEEGVEFDERYLE